VQALFLVCLGVGLGWLLIGVVGGHAHGGHGGAAHSGVAHHGGGTHGGAPHGPHAHHGGAATGGRGAPHVGLRGLGSPLVVAGALALAGAVGEVILLVSPLDLLAAGAGAILGLLLGALGTLALLDRLLRAQTPEIGPADYVGWRGVLLQSLVGGGDIAEMMASSPDGAQRRCLRVRTAEDEGALVRDAVVVVTAEAGGGVYEVTSEERLLRG